MNVDAAIHSQNNHTGFGFVLRDQTGRFKVAKIWTSPRIFDVMTAEAIALRDALHWCCAKI